MPFYEYQCKSCGHDLEAMQKISDPPLKKCPNCGKSQLQRLMSAPVFRLKGGGWYETDFKGDQDNKKNLADRPDADAPKDLPKDLPQDGAASGADAKSKDGDGKDAKADTAAAKDTTPKDTTPKDTPKGKPPETARAEPAKQPDSRKSPPRMHTPGRGKSAAKRPIKRPVHKAKRRV
jgi:putative FmdB family regulatory protein